MRYSNLKKCVTLTLEEGKPFVWYVSKTGGKYYTICLHDGNMSTDRFANEDVCKKSILVSVKKILDNYVNLSQLSPRIGDLIYEYKKISVSQFSYFGSC